MHISLQRNLWHNFSAEKYGNCHIACWPAVCAAHYAFSNRRVTTWFRKFCRTPE